MNISIEPRLKNKHLLLFGAGIMQIPAIIIAKKMGFHVTVFDGNEKALGKELCDTFWNVDFSNELLASDKALEINKIKKVDAVFTLGTDFSTTVSSVAAKLKLPGIPYESALRAKNKGLMRKILSENGIAVPSYIAGTVEELKSGMENLNFPTVVKPVDSMGARGVQLVNNEEELKVVMESSLEYSSSSKLIVEEKIIGTEYSIDCLVLKSKVYPKGIATRLIDYEPFFIERGHSFPSGLKTYQEKSICEIMEAAAAALGIPNGMLKGDVFLTDKGPVIGEVAARLSGGFMSGWTYPEFADESAIEQGLLLALGEYELLEQILVKKIPLTTDRSVAERALISIPGTIKELKRSDRFPFVPMEQVFSRKNGEYFFYQANPYNKELTFPVNNVEKAGNLIAVVQSDEKTAAINRAETAISSMYVHLESNTRQTDDGICRIHHVAYPENLKRLNSSWIQDQISFFFESNQSSENEYWQWDEKDWNFCTLTKGIGILQKAIDFNTQLQVLEKILSSESKKIIKKLLPQLDFKEINDTVLANIIFLLFHFIGGLQLSIYVTETLAILSGDEAQRRLVHWLSQIEKRNILFPL